MGRRKTAGNKLPSQDELKELLIYDPETGKLFWKKRSVDKFSDGKHPAQRNCDRWNGRFSGSEAFTATKGDGYKHGQLMGQWVSAHRVAWKIETGEAPDEIDHINGKRDDNAWENLRDVEPRVNHKNASKPKRNTSGVVGVRYNKLRGYWQAFITVDYHFHSLGVYKDISDAIAARKAAELEFGFHANHGR